MKSIIRIILIGCMVQVANAQSSESIDSVAIKFANTITQEDMSRHLHIISGDDFEGRETGYEGQRKTEEYLVNHYRSIGIKEHNETYLQYFDLTLRDQQKVDVYLKNDEFSFIKDYYYYPPGVADCKIKGDVIFGGYGIATENYNDLKETDFSNKIVVVFDGEPEDSKGSFLLSGDKTASKFSKREEKQKLFAEKNAKAVFIVKKEYEKNVKSLKAYFSHKTMGLVDNIPNRAEGMPVFYISSRMAMALLGTKSYKKALKSAIKMSGSTGVEELSIDFRRDEEKLRSSNVLAYIEGSDKKEELIILSAHYDHIGVEGDLVFNGADDDGSGTVAVMEIAEAFQKAKDAGQGPRRSVLFLNVSGEEKGLLGSEYYSEHPVFPLENTVANLNIDMIGRVDPVHKNDSNYVYIIGSNMLSEDLHEVNEEMQKKYSDIQLDYTFNSLDDPNRFYYRSDHYNFAKNNIPVIFYFTGVHEDYHKATDTVDKIMFEKLTRITKLIFHTAWELVNREDRIELTNPN